MNAPQSESKPSHRLLRHVRLALGIRVEQAAVAIGRSGQCVEGLEREFRKVRVDREQTLAAYCDWLHEQATGKAKPHLALERWELCPDVFEEPAPAASA